MIGDERHSAAASDVCRGGVHGGDERCISCGAARARRRLFKHVPGLQ